MSGNPLVRGLMLLGAVLSLVLGIVGIFVPGLPTTPFILLAAWFATRSSPRLLAWLESHRLFGPMVTHWRAHGAVSRRAKWLATLMMALCALLLWLAVKNFWLAVVASAAMAVVLAWLWHRPEPSSASADLGGPTLPARSYQRPQGDRYEHDR